MFEVLFGLYLLASSELSMKLSPLPSPSPLPLQLPSQSPSENPLKRSKRVVGGNLAYIDQMPYMVNIRRDGVFECGGSLITPNCVLTAAHCVKSGKPEDFIVRGGVTYLRDIKNIRRVKSIFIPKLYDKRSLNYDIAIFKLQSSFKSSKMKTIQLGSKMPAVGESVQVSGWGLTSETSQFPSNQLRTISVNILPQSHCRELYKNYRNLTENMFCASVPGLKDACSADSGGPAVFNGKIVGIVSWGKSYECARATSPGVYVNVPSIRHWIDNIVQQFC